jgi:peptide/nickel transport system permease protein
LTAAQEEPRNTEVLTFLVRRLLASFLVLLVASYIVYVLTAYSGDPLEDLRQSTARNKDYLIEQRTLKFNLDVPPPLRYFIWLSGLLRGFIGQFTLGENILGQAVTDQVGSAIGMTLQLITASLVLAVLIGITIGITTALRQYSTYDYSATFLSFLFFSLPSFWVAVMLKQYVGIAFNDYLEDPIIPPLVVVGIALVAGVVWMVIIGGPVRRRLIVFTTATLSTGAVFTFIAITDWFNDPSLGIAVIALLGAGVAVLVTALVSGLRNRKALYTSLTVALVGVALYYPFQLISLSLTLWSVIALGVLTIVVGVVIGWLFAGPDRDQSMRAGGITALFVGLLVLLDRFMQSWDIYVGSGTINGRPIGTVGSATPGLTGSFWVEGIDVFTHLLLPTTGLMLISLAGYSRYSRASLLEVMNQDYIRTARAKGLTERTVVVRHAFRNALIPLTTIVAFDVGGLIGGAVITENVFGWSGMGKLFIDALTTVDVNQMMGFFLVTGMVAITFNLLADLAYSALDPRIRVNS